MFITIQNVKLAAANRWYRASATCKSLYHSPVSPKQPPPYKDELSLGAVPIHINIRPGKHRPRPNNKHRQESPVVNVTALFSGLINFFGGHFAFFVPGLHLISRLTPKSGSPTPKTHT